MRARWKWYVGLDLARRAFEAPNQDPGVHAAAKDALKQMGAPDWPFSAMMRYFVREVWQLNLA